MSEPVASSRLFFFFVSTVLLVLQLVLSQPSPIITVDPDENKTTPEIIESRGYEAHTHFVTTSDGYILALHRIVNTLVDSPQPPVIVQHGLVGSSADFVINSPGGGVADAKDGVVGNNLGFELTKAGYDVWMPNTRGNTYSTNHTTLDPKKHSQFWSFSYDEMIAYDLPAIIDFVMNETNTKTVAYVGHSQGTLLMFGLLSTIPKYNDIIQPFIAMAPISSVKYMKSPIRYLAYNPILLEYYKWRGGPFLVASDLIRYLADKVCDSAYRPICSNIMFLFTGYDIPQLNMTRMPVYYSHTPAGTSALNVIHYAQGVVSGNFAKYDFGKHENMRKYGNKTPPAYPVEKITCKNIALLYGLNDWLADVRDVKDLKDRLKVNLIDSYEVPLEKWNHVDFIWAKDCGRIINRRVINLLDKYS